LSPHLLSKNVNIKIYKTIILPVVLYGCENWSHMLREEDSMMVSKNRKLTRISERRRHELTGSWKKNCTGEELYRLYSSNQGG
jgi:hypothetical protein